MISKKTLIGVAALIGTVVLVAAVANHFSEN